MFKNLKIGMRLGLGSGLALILLVVIAFLNITRGLSEEEMPVNRTKIGEPGLVLSIGKTF